MFCSQDDKMVRIKKKTNDESKVMCFIIKHEFCHLFLRNITLSSKSYKKPWNNNITGNDFTKLLNFYATLLLYIQKRLGDKTFTILHYHCWRCQICINSSTITG